MLWPAWPVSFSVMWSRGSSRPARRTISPARNAPTLRSVFETGDSTTTAESPVKACSSSGRSSASSEARVDCSCATLWPGAG